MKVQRKKCNPSILVTGQSRENATDNGAMVAGIAVLAERGQRLLEAAPLFSSTTHLADLPSVNTCVLQQGLPPLTIHFLVSPPFLGCPSYPGIELALQS